MGIVFLFLVCLFVSFQLSIEPVVPATFTVLNQCL